MLRSPAMIRCNSWIMSRYSTVPDLSQTTTVNLQMQYSGISEACIPAEWSVLVDLLKIDAIYLECN